MVSKLGSALLFFRFWFEYIWFQAWKFAGIFEKQASVPTEVMILISYLWTDTPPGLERGGGVCTHAINIFLSYLFTKYRITY